MPKVRTAWSCTSNCPTADRHSSIACAVSRSYDQIDMFEFTIFASDHFTNLFEIIYEIIHVYMKSNLYEGMKVIFVVES